MVVIFIAITESLLNKPDQIIPTIPFPFVQSSNGIIVQNYDHE